MEEKIPENTGEIRDEKGRFIKGVSGNPAGKPPGSLSIIAEIKKQLDEIAEEDPQKRKKLELLVRKIILKAINDGDTAMIRDIIDRVHGKPAQSIDMNVNSMDDLRKEYFEKLNELDERYSKDDIQK